MIEAKLGSSLVVVMEKLVSREIERDRMERIGRIEKKSTVKP